MNRSQEYNEAPRDSSMVNISLSLDEEGLQTSEPSGEGEERGDVRATSQASSAVMRKFAVDWNKTTQSAFQAQSAATCYYGTLFFMLMILPAALAGVSYAMGMPPSSSEIADDSAAYEAVSATPAYPVVTQAPIMTTEAVPGANDGFDTAHYFAMWFYMGIEMFMGVMDNSIAVPKTRTTVEASVGTSRPHSFGSCAYGSVMLAGSFFVSLTMCLAHCEDPEAVKPYTAIFLVFAGLVRLFESGSHALLDRKHAATITHVPVNTKDFWINPACGNPHVRTHPKENEKPEGLPMHPANCRDWVVAIFGATAMCTASGALMQFAVCKEGSMAGDADHGAGWAAAVFYVIPMIRHVKTLADPRTRTARAGIGLGLKGIEMFAVTVKACMSASPAVIAMAALQAVKSSFMSFTTVSHRVAQSRHSVDRAHQPKVVTEVNPNADYAGVSL